LNKFNLSRRTNKMPNGFMFYVKAFSPLHAGVGQSIDKVDLPIEREVHTQYPCVFATGLKGSLRSFCKHNKTVDFNDTIIEKIFGKEDGEIGMGSAVFTDLKILFFPVRSSEGSFKYVTCEAVIKRFERDFKLIFPEISYSHENKKADFGELVTCIEKADQFEPNAHIILEDYIFIKHPKGELSNRFGIKLNDVYVIENKFFTYLVTNATQIIARNKLDDKKISENLWYEEALPAETVLYSFVLPSIIKNGEIDKLKTFINNKVVQIGGNETVGYGICELKNI